MSQQTETIYAVFARTDIHPDLLGHVTGEAKDIEAFYHERRQYGLIIEPITVNHIPKGFAESKAAVYKRKKELQKQLIEVEAQLKEMGGR